MKKSSGKAKKICFVIFVISLFVDTVLMGLFAWFQTSYGVTFREIIYTIRSPRSGANNIFFLTASGYVLPKLAIFIVVLAVAVFVFFLMERYILMDLVIRIGTGDGRKKIDGIKALKVLFFALVVGYSVYVLISINSRLEITKFISDYNARTGLYDEHYVMPDAAKITCDSDKPKNLLYIYMESMETTYASREVGGEQPEINYIPNLTKIAEDNISFSDEEGIGGFVSAKNTDWTMAALWATETGAAFNFPIEGNSDFGDQEHFSKNSVTLGDILNEKGYYQEFLCGSDATFGGRKAFFEQHGNFRIYDKFTAEEEGYLLPTEEVNWGLEDWRLYEIAKDELTRMSEHEPFNMTMLTVDTHHYDGWICPKCGDTYPEKLANVLVCADDQIKDFLDWCSQQDWYDNTVIVIQGDHPRMDQSLVNKAKDRMVYNCFIGSVHDKDKASLNMKNRSWNTMDMFPTVLSAMGYKIEGGRLGLGTDMFSGEPTLCEQLGSDYIDDEVQKYSQYYADHFY